MEIFIKVLAITPEPDYVIKGDELTTKVLVRTDEQPRTIEKIEIFVEVNGRQLETDEVMIQRHLAIFEEFTYEYTYAIPTFGESGHWSIKIIAYDDLLSQIACTTSEFDLE